MKRIFLWLLGVVFFLISLILLFAGDFAFSLSGIHWGMAVAGLVAVLASALALYPLLRAIFGDSPVADPKIAAGLAAWCCIVLILTFGAKRFEIADGASALARQTGNCGTLFSSAAYAEWFQSWISGERPAVRYGYRVLEDICRVSKLRAAFAPARPAICADRKTHDPAECYAQILNEMANQAPLTLPGVDLAFALGMALATDMPNTPGAKDGEVKDEFRLAADTFDLTAATLHAFGRHAAPASLPPGQSPRADPKWEVMRLIYKHHRISADDEARLLGWADRNAESALAHVLLESVDRINKKLDRQEKDARNPAARVSDPETTEFKDRISHDIQFFKEYAIVLSKGYKL